MFSFVRPVAVTEGILTSSNVALEAIWNSGATYAAGDRVRLSVDTTHRLYESLQAGNTNHNPAESASDWWLDVGPQNRWALFDEAVGTQTANAESVEVEVTPPSLINAVGLLNVDAASARVTMTDPVEGVVFDSTFPLISTSGISDWWSYLFEPIERLRDKAVFGLPSYSGATVAVELNAPGATAKIGNLVLGFEKVVGGTRWGATVGFIDYSRKDTDDFGVTTVTKRAFSKRASFDLIVASASTDVVQNLFAEYRATPLLWRGSDAYGSTLIYGYLREFSMVIAYPTHSECSIEIEGLSQQ